MPYLSKCLNSFDMSLNPLQGGNFIHTDERQENAGPIMQRFSLRGKTAIVTGAAAGIGWAVAQALAEMGANIAIWYNTNKKGPMRAEEIQTRYGVKCVFSDCTLMLALVLMFNRSGLSSQCLGCSSSTSGCR